MRWLERNTESQDSPAAGGLAAAPPSLAEIPATQPSPPRERAPAMDSSLEGEDPSAQASRDESAAMFGGLFQNDSISGYGSLVGAGSAPIPIVCASADRLLCPRLLAVLMFRSLSVLLSGAVCTSALVCWCLTART